jgi:methionyl aminopeptidase
MTPQKAIDIKHMEESCQLAAVVLQHVGKHAKAGISTEELDKIAHDFITTRGAIPSPLNYHGYPKSICTSVNDCICHGVPDETILKDGDIVNIDVTVYYKEHHGDTSATFLIGNVSESAKKVCDCAQKAMERGIEAIYPGATTGDIGFAINKYTTKQGFYVVKEIGGHGIGRNFHEDPFVPSFGKRGRGTPLRPFRCLTVEPMINETDVATKEFPVKGSTIKYYHTGDGTLSAQYEHTVLVTDESYEVLTLL